MEKHHIRIVVFSNASQEASDEVDRLIDKHCLEVEDWMEKDYGLLIMATFESDNLTSVRSDFGNIHGVTWSEY
jgi:hypothetical protein